MQGIIKEQNVIFYCSLRPKPANHVTKMPAPKLKLDRDDHIGNTLNTGMSKENTEAVATLSRILVRLYQRNARLFWA